MKRFTLKFFLLAIGMILSVGTYAQDEITHRYPAVRFKTAVNGNEFVIPAFDVKLDDTYSTSNGFIRVQKKANGNGKIVTGMGLIYYDNGTIGHTFPDMKKEGNSAVKVYVYSEKTSQFEEVVAREATYGQFFNRESYTGSEDVYIFRDSKNSYLPVQVGRMNPIFTVPTTCTWYDNNQPAIIDEIDDFGFSNYTFGTASDDLTWLNRCVITDLTIPSGIKEMGVAAFQAIATLKHVVIEDGGVTDIPVRCFDACHQLQTIKLSNSIEHISVAAFGLWGSIQKITFTSIEPPTFGKNSEYGGKLYYNGQETADHGIFASTKSTKNYSHYNPLKCIIEFPLISAKEYMESAAGTFLQGKKFALSSPFTMSSSGLSTCCSPLDFTVKQYNKAYTSNDDKWVDSDLEAFYVNSANVKVTSVTLTDIDQNTKISAGEGVILKGTAGAPYGLFFPYANSQPSSLSDLGDIDNSLVGVIEDKNWDEDDYDPDYYYFILNGGKFRPVTPSGTLKANKAYLMIGNNPGFDLGGGTQNALSIEFSEGTRIGSTQMEKVHDDAIYTLQGVQVNQPQKGIFIKNGKKVVIK